MPRISIVLFALPLFAAAPPPADIDGSGKRVVLNQPLIGAKAEAPDYSDQTPLPYRTPSYGEQFLTIDLQALGHAAPVL